MKLRNTVCAAALVAAGVLAAGSAASAQDYGRMVVFGDSLSDTNNAFTASGGASPPAPYFSGRFSNGPVWVEQMGFGTFANFFSAPSTLTGNVDYAFGGARADTAASPVPGVPTQVGAYMAAGGQFHATDLVSVWAGANDLFQAMPTAAAQPSPTNYMFAASNTAAGAVAGSVNTIANAGAGTIMVSNLPDLGATPQFRATTAEPLATLSTGFFNDALLAQMNTQAAAHANTNIIYVDVARAYRAVLADPGKFGFDNVTQKCFTGVSVCATPNTYVFWDGVHPTQAGHALLAAVATDYVTYGDSGAASAAQAEAGVFARRAAFDAAREQVGEREFETGSRTFARVEASSGSVDARGVIAEGDVDTIGMRLGFDHAFSSQMRVGVIAGATQSDVQNGPSSFDLNSASADLYMGWRSGQLFVDATAGASFDNYDISRQTALAGAVHHAETDGSSFGSDLRVGWWGNAGGWTMSPRVGLSAIHASVDGYSEEGSVARHEIGEREVSAVSAEASVLFAGDLSERFGATFEVGYRDYLKYSGDDVSVGLVDNPAHTLFRSVEEPDGGVVMLDAGVNGTVGDNIGVRVGYRGRFGDGFDSHTGGVNITFKY
ncbi:autotransporter domain-containing protein [Caulobacter sp. 17J65-9]|uniref:autotransporter domain-containing protein n=1 Tax=Caulobacter sp. 17J65-9 TaxID=2709382 RepID=UPI0013CB4634|nr:autotransporter domain-containing protein [Caulobacter sp. 17J65-9]NEX93701.1 autotransporter domain-containing protein [Caulobacter sp. 17J65-9]